MERVKKRTSRIRPEPGGRMAQAPAEGVMGGSYETMFKRLPVAVYRSTLEGRLITMNPALVKMLGFRSPADLKHIDVRRFFVDEKDRKKHFRALDKNGATMSVFRLKRKDGRVIWIRDFARAVKGPDGRILCTDGVMRDISGEKRIEIRLKRTLSKLAEANAARDEMIRQLEKVSITDDLTGLYNRRGFNVLARQHLLLVDRRKSLTYLLYLDLDHLKRINDTFGHRIGDEALVSLAEILQATFRLSDIKARMGGDEFAVFPIDTNEEGVNTALGRLEKAVADFNASGKKPFNLSLSTGMAGYDPANPSSIEDLLGRADNLMYEAKRRKNGIQRA